MAYLISLNDENTSLTEVNNNVIKFSAAAWETYLAIKEGKELGYDEVPSKSGLDNLLFYQIVETTGNNKFKISEAYL